MQRRSRKYLFDIHEACKRLEEFTGGRTLVDYQRDAMLRSAVERQFEIVGEAMSRMLKVEPILAESIRDTRKIIGFRNFLIHAYSDISDKVVWTAVQNNLPALVVDVDALLDDSEDALPEDDD